ncbi:MAG: LAGLIDADG family homing endonuclease [Minisyncoccia bacterium]
MGSRSNIDLAYIAGFLDGDGSLMLQIKKRADGKSKIRFMATICFYQDTRHQKDLLWIRKILSIGYLSKRNDGMSELRVNGFKQTKKILENLIPYIKFKKIQAKALFESCEILSKTKFNRLSPKQLTKLVDLILVIQNENYVTKKKKTRGELFRILGLTP